MDQTTNGIETQKNTYSIISYKSSSFPEQYRNLIFSKWMRSFRYGNDYIKLINSDDYFAAYEIYITSLLNKPNSTLRLAVLSEDKDVVLGWSLIDGETLHYVYVQNEQRNKGIAKFLVPVSIKTITHVTKSGLAIWNKKIPFAKFNPF